MRKEGLENPTRTGHIERNRDREKQRVSYIMSFYKQIIEQRLGEITKRQILSGATTDGLKVVESQDRSRSEGTMMIF